MTLVLVLTITQLQYKFQYRTRSYELLLLNLVYCCMILLIRLFTIPLIVTFHSKSSNKCYSHVVNWLKIIALVLFCFVFVCPMLSLSLDCPFLIVTSVFSNCRLSDFSFYIDSQISIHRKFKKIDQLII